MSYALLFNEQLRCFRIILVHERNISKPIGVTSFIDLGYCVFFVVNKEEALCFSSLFFP